MSPKQTATAQYSFIKSTIKTATMRLHDLRRAASRKQLPLPAFDETTARKLLGDSAASVQDCLAILVEASSWTSLDQARLSNLEYASAKTAGAFQDAFAAAYLAMEREQRAQRQLRSNLFVWLPNLHKEFVALCNQAGIQAPKALPKLDAIATVDLADLHRTLITEIADLRTRIEQARLNREQRAKAERQRADAYRALPALLRIAR